MQTNIDIHVHDTKKIVVERAFEKALIRIHLIDNTGRRETVLRVWNADTKAEWPEVEMIDEKPEPIVVETEETDP